MILYHALYLHSPIRIVPAHLCDHVRHYSRMSICTVSPIQVCIPLQSYPCARRVTTYLDLWLCVVIRTKCFLGDVAPTQCLRYRPRGAECIYWPSMHWPSNSVRHRHCPCEVYGYPGIASPSSGFINLGLLSELPLRNTCSYHWIFVSVWKRRFKSKFAPPIVRH